MLGRAETFFLFIIEHCAIALSGFCCWRSWLIGDGFCFMEQGKVHELQRSDGVFAGDLVGESDTGGSSGDADHGFKRTRGDWESLGLLLGAELREGLGDVVAGLF